MRLAGWTLHRDRKGVRWEPPGPLRASWSSTHESSVKPCPTEGGLQKFHPLEVKSRPTQAQ